MEVTDVRMYPQSGASGGVRDGMAKVGPVLCFGLEVSMHTCPELDLV